MKKEKTIARAGNSSSERHTLILIATRWLENGCIAPFQILRSLSAVTEIGTLRKAEPASTTRGAPYQVFKGDNDTQ